MILLKNCSYNNSYLITISNYITLTFHLFYRNPRFFFSNPASATTSFSLITILPLRNANTQVIPFWVILSFKII